MPATDPPPVSPLPSLLVDTMLARLGRWLRLLGADAADREAGTEDDLLAVLRGSGRTLLTRHRRRAARLGPLGIPVLLVAANDLGGQLREIRRRHRLPDPSSRFTRCSLCNAPLEPRTLESVRDWIPPFVARTRTRFSACPRCGRIYWSSTHPERFERHLARMLRPPPGS